MRLLPASCALLAFLGGCGGGGGDPTIAGGDCASGSRALCLTGCSLGCTLQGCELTQIAQNQPLSFAFSQEVDPLSVTTASCTLKTASGEEPVGVWMVHRQVITFVPELRMVGSQSFFGFKANESYVLSLRGGSEGDVVRATSGDRLPQSFHCTLAVTRGVVDLDGQPPEAFLLSPSSQLAAPRDTPLVVGFSEVLDPTAFAGTNSRTGPVRLRIRGAENQSGTLVCVDDPAPVEAGYRVANDLALGRTTLTLLLP